MKNLLISALIAVAAFSVGYITCHKVNDVEFLIEANNFKKELLDAQDQTIYYAWKLIDKHDLLDKDGSDEMCDFLEYNDKVNELLKTQL